MVCLDGCWMVVGMAVGMVVGWLLGWLMFGWLDGWMSKTILMIKLLLDLLKLAQQVITRCTILCKEKWSDNGTWIGP